MAILLIILILLRDLFIVIGVFNPEFDNFNLIFEILVRICGRLRDYFIQYV